jgi:hypothetical protein
MSLLSVLNGADDIYPCAHPWPQDCFVQAGGDGVVVAKEGSYRTAFFEAFPRSPDVFIRGEGETVDAAEEDAWRRYMRVVDGHEHEWDRRDRTDGYAHCLACGIGCMVFEPLTNCAVCAIPAAYGQDAEAAWYCEAHHKELPDDRLPEWSRRMRQWVREIHAEDEAEREATAG